MSDDVLKREAFDLVSVGNVSPWVLTREPTPSVLGREFHSKDHPTWLIACAKVLVHLVKQAFAAVKVDVIHIV